MAAGLAVLGAAVCAWGALCLLFWQGSWQLLYHPVAAVTRTPASVGLAFDAVGFATTEAGETRLKGWWIPAGADARYTVLYLHGQDGNLGDTVDELATLHAAGVNVLAFDYRGYGQSQFARPSEARWREDAEWALHYLTGTRQAAAGSVVVMGSELGANLALEVGAAHPELAGVVVRDPLDRPMDAIFGDARARLVPAHWLVEDRFDAEGAAGRLRVPCLWILTSPPRKKIVVLPDLAAYAKIATQKQLAWLDAAPRTEGDEVRVVAGWLGGLHR
jgi:hypothetical protein